MAFPTIIVMVTHREKMRDGTAEKRAKCRARAAKITRTRFSLLLRAGSLFDLGEGNIQRGRFLFVVNEKKLYFYGGKKEEVGCNSLGQG